MLEIAEHRAERAEFEGLMASGILRRAPHLVSFFTYVCERYFEGQTDQIKEYTIGVEALKRPPSFDPKKDSIVRVEAHRLRRRLNEYYAAEGAKHAIQIVIPNGQYARSLSIALRSGKPISIETSCIRPTIWSLTSRSIWAGTHSIGGKAAPQISSSLFSRLRTSTLLHGTVRFLEAPCQGYSTSRCPTRRNVDRGRNIASPIRIPHAYWLLRSSFRRFAGAELGF